MLNNNGIQIHGGLVLEFFTTIPVMHPQLLWWTQLSVPKGENNERTRSWGTLLGSQHFGSRGACWSFGMGIRKSDKQVNYSHRLAQAKQQVGQCVVKTFLVHKRAMGKHGLTRLITAWTWGKPSPSPL
jgi:hypothetical protein